MTAQDTRHPRRRLLAALEWVFAHLGWLPVPANGLLTIAGAVLLGTIGDLPDGGAVLRMVLGIIAMAISFSIVAALDWWRRATERAADYEGAQANVTLTEAVEPIVQLLALMPRQPSDVRKRTRDKVVAHACTSMLLILRDVHGLRATVYRVSDSGSTLEVLDSHGRKDQPRKFSKGDGGDGDDVFDLVTTRSSELILDTRIDQRTRHSAPSKYYKTFIRAPIRANERGYGMMTVDAPQPGDLSDADRQVVEVLAGMLAIAAGLVEK